jgi:hypothetical protein
MHLLDYTLKLLGLSETIHRWHGALSALEAGRREKIARYAEEIAATLARAAAAFAILEKDPAAARPRQEAVRELGRIAGYVEDIVRLLERHLDGRKARSVFQRAVRQLRSGRSRKSPKSLEATGGLCLGTIAWRIEHVEEFRRSTQGMGEES